MFPTNTKLGSHLKLGFTFIELLVSIAILGALASIILIATNSARDKTKDVAIQQNLESIRTAGIIYRSDYGNYGTISGADCDTTNFFVHKPVKDAIVAVRAIHNSPGTCLLGDSAPGTLGLIAKSWAVSFPLVSNNSSWCVDSKGRSVSGVAIIDPNDVATCQ